MRPALMVVDNPDPEKLSTRKLVLETAKFNIINVTSAEEAIETLSRLDLHGVILPYHLPGTNCADLSARLREVRPNVKILVSEGSGCQEDGVFNGHDPATLVALCRKMFGDPLIREIKQQQADVQSV
jgi:DNA-binding response OmpR family regulator